MPVDEELEGFVKKLDPMRLKHKELAVRYKNLSEDNRAREEFNTAAHMRIVDSRYGKLGEDSKNELDMLVSHSGQQIEDAVELHLSGTDLDLAYRLFEWAAENSFVTENILNSYTKHKRFEYIAKAFLWRGYALLVLGKYGEACPLFKGVVPYFVRYRKSFGTIYWVVEYNLPKALIPLCEYKLEPNKENKKKAIKGLNDYINSLKVDARLDGYLYYYHLKETFPDVYSDSE